MSGLNWHGNASGRGTAEGLPLEIKELWNWGAFLLCPFWALAHKKYLIAFLSALIPGVNIYAGYMGNKWAWEKVEWKSIDHFQQEQKLWARISLGFYMLLLVIKLSPIVFRK